MYRFDTPPSKEAVDGINALEDLGLQIAFLTHRPREMRSKIRAWMMSHQLPIPWILRFIGPDGDIPTILSSLGARVVIETDGDAAENLAKSGVFVILIDREDNRDVLPGRQIIRVASWDEAVNRIAAEIALAIRLTQQPQQTDPELVR